ncbi:3-hydroxyacyl-ACP dehydratase FabZ family protein [Hazenella coriacea]|uniref:3-hydroxyacyl-[acyl-carrier-protein] dehydratase n=1 Tax=Hazenella coriacea TaxID=1179467 RepID=A0A4R3KZZ8_9BACL|nr:3-hydroxyacyl-ACP dehydratase FabZ family protein [Hazenella coriacea]TCS92401.1 3-hydroxyacyl-[acyl-carrier-protein] dehydratase [Hazenella coriacea]
MDDLLSVLPHRYPFLFVDRIVEKELGVWVKGYKNLSRNEWFFMNNKDATLPGMIAVEAIAQLSAFVLENNSSSLGFLASLKGVSIENQARPGDRLDLYFEVTRQRKRMLSGRGEARVNDRLIVSVEEMIIMEPA